MQWAGQLGDGRAISLGEAVAPDGGIYELQLKVQHTPRSCPGPLLETCWCLVSHPIYLYHAVRGDCITPLPEQKIQSGASLTTLASRQLLIQAHSVSLPKCGLIEDIRFH